MSNCQLTYLDDANSRIHPIELLRKIAQLRGCDSSEQVAQFLNPAPSIPNPLLRYPSISNAIDRVNDAITRHQRIVIFGDYDADGICSVAILIRVLRFLGSTPAIFLPVRHRDDYGLTSHAITQCLKEDKPELLICVDCGTNTFNSVQIAREHHCDCIIIDHHQAGDGLSSNALCLINPKIHGIESPGSELCAAGLCHFFAFLLASDRFWDASVSLILAGMATLIDVVELRLLNRSLVKHSLHLFNQTAYRCLLPGLDRLLESHQMANSHTYGYHLGPILNASGRLEDARLSLNLLLCENYLQAEALAIKCIQVNERRKVIQKDIILEALKFAEKLMNGNCPKVIVMGKPHWTPGVVGIVASRIKEIYHRPVLIYGHDAQGNCKGSGRSVPGFDLGHTIRKAVLQGILFTGGGHAMAAGFCAKDSAIAELSEFLNSECHLSEADFCPRYEVLHFRNDMKAADWSDFLALLEPFGAGNSKPSILVERAELLRPVHFASDENGAPLKITTQFKVANGPNILCSSYFSRSLMERLNKGSVFRILLQVKRETKAPFRSLWSLRNAEIVPA